MKHDASSFSGQDGAVLAAITPLRRAGFGIHWLHPRSKAPAVGERWSTLPVATLDDLQRTYRHGNNVGVRLGQPSLLVCGLYLHALDIDIRVTGSAAEAWREIDRLFPGVNLRAFPSVISGSGGESRHIYLMVAQPFKGKKLARSADFQMVFDPQKGREVKKFNWEIELFGTGKQIAMPPSIHPETGLPYRWEREFDFDALCFGEGPFVAAEVIEAAGAIADEGDDGSANTERLGLTLDEASDILADLPLDEWCEDRDGWTSVGMALKHEFGDDGYELWCEFSRQSTKFDARNQQTVWKSFKGRTSRPKRMATLKAAARDARLLKAFDDLPESGALTPGDGGEADEFSQLITGAQASSPVTGDDGLACFESDEKSSASDAAASKGVVDFNARHHLAFVEGKAIILSPRRDGGVAYGTPADLHALYDNVRHRTEKSSEPISKVWMRHPKRLTFTGGITFAPQGAPPDTFNLWSGFAVAPDPTSTCDLFLAHLRNVVCSSDEVTFGWVIRWFAHMIQRPWEKPGTALVLKGCKGAGKDTVGDYVGGLFPRHHTKIANAEHLTGKFNAHHQATLLLHLEEAFWAGDRSAEGRLKHIITSDKLLIEPKGVNAFSVDSVFRLFISSNEEWVVPASFDERRFCVLVVSSAVAKRKPYFDALRAEMNGSGRAALLHYLQQIDLGDFDVRNPPVTAGLRDQKLQSLRNFDRWWYETLTDGDLPGLMSRTLDEEGTPSWEGQSVRVNREALRGAYRLWMKDRRFDGEVLGDAAFGKALREMLPSVKTCRPQAGGALRLFYYGLPPLPVCRDEFDKKLGAGVDWQTAADEI